MRSSYNPHTPDPKRTSLPTQTTETKPLPLTQPLNPLPLLPLPIPLNPHLPPLSPLHRKCIHNPPIKFRCIDSRECNLLAQIVGQEFDEVAVAVEVQARGVCEGCVLVVDSGVGVGCDGEFEVQSCWDPRRGRGGVSFGEDVRGLEGMKIKTGEIWNM